MRSPKTSWDKEKIQSLLQSNAVALERAILLVYANQTASEKAAGATNQNNGVGFNGTDASFMSSIAGWLGRARAEEGHRLSLKQQEIARSIIMKYWRQVQDEIIRREAQKNLPKGPVEVELEDDVEWDDEAKAWFAYNN
jgi:hypothetical protein